MNVNYEFLALRRLSKRNINERDNSDTEEEELSRPILYWDEMEPGEARKFLRENPEANEKFIEKRKNVPLLLKFYLYLRDTLTTPSSQDIYSVK